MARYRRYLAALGAILLGLAATPAWAQTLTPVELSVADFGNIVPGASGTTNFTSTAAGAVSQSGGTAVRKSSGLVRSQIKVECVGTSNQCDNAVYVKIGSIGTPTGRAGSLSTFTVTSASGNIASSTGSNPRTFRITPVNGTTRASFYIGMRMPIGASGAVGPATSPFYVYVGTSSNPTTGAQFNAIANTYRGIAVSGTALNFGKIARPTVTAGTKEVKIDPDLNERTIGGVLAPGTFARSTFTITGENSMAITVSQSGSMTMTRSGGGSLSVTLTRSTLPTMIGTSGSTGSQGTSVFYTGGQFNVTPTTATGNYSGTFSTTVSYN